MSDEKVVNIFEAKSKKKVKEENEEQEEFSFEEIMERNKRNKERLDKERSKANRSVKRSHRLDKPKK